MPAHHKTLEDASIRLGSVASDVLGVSGRAMLSALVAGERHPQVLAKLARGRPRNRLPHRRAPGLLGGTLPRHHVTGGKRRSGKPTRATAGWVRC
jgi:transposase